MLDIGWSELLLIGVVALIVVGPKDLPHLFHSLGRFTARARSMAREFTSAMEDAAKSSGIDEAANSIKDVKSLTSKKSLGLDALDRAAERFEKWDPSQPAKTARPDPAAPQPAEEPPKAEIPPAAEPLEDVTAADEATTGKRRLHAVRRSDMKDD
ncbi:Sec-independent protein translocase protein TatB [Paracoccus methylarcula]|uniref:Sec-independent protein translocase protein TatB n=1 Tax=Paracoccus methylarcula TaxID=72022 RepID=A0A3R7NAQ8_9RHOB|nr:Sec-independent protein translocase protein TatB [Paracoccus methylarcula]RNF33553.1 twin-arginine translocase subunit TatB [Paracoccus methylarcula]